ncbi:MAG TPA: ROK family protein [Thermomicrobiales bacterium]|nr:ROK family protein [Thermomicrobiales bacterium]
MRALGIDIGGSGIKGAPVDTETGILVADRLRISTPDPSTPEAVAATVARITEHFGGNSALGCAFPAIVQRGVVRSAANVDTSWIGVDGAALLSRATGRPVTLLNDADAAGMAEVTFGAGRDHTGVVMILTFGTGIGSAIFTGGHLLPNTELGHLEIRGMDAEHRASDRVRKSESLDWEDWAERVNEYLAMLEALFSPDLFIVGGGVSKDHARFLHLFETKARIVPATLRNEAGIVGAALATAPARRD